MKFLFQASMATAMFVLVLASIDAMIEKDPAAAAIKGLRSAILILSIVVGGGSLHVGEKKS